jgi:putative endonuclease
MKPHIYFVYIITNPKKTVYYTGVTNDIVERLQQHFDSRGKGDHFASKYFCYNLLYYEEHLC